MTRRPLNLEKLERFSKDNGLELLKITLRGSLETATDNYRRLKRIDN